MIRSHASEWCLFVLLMSATLKSAYFLPVNAPNPLCSQTIARIGAMRLLPVVTVVNAYDVLAVADRLLACHLPILEVTMRTPQATQAIHQLRSEAPEILIGAGTVTSIEVAAAALEAGADFLTSPGLDLDLVEWCNQKEVAIIPGVATATEIMSAARAGVTVSKFFPAESSGGITKLKDWGGPFKSMKFLATGGIDSNNLERYLQCENVLACAGSWLTQKYPGNTGERDALQTILNAVSVVERLRVEQGTESLTDGMMDPKFHHEMLV